MFSIEDQQPTLPDPIALDTSFVVEALLATQSLHDVCDAFLKRMFDSGVSVATSELLRVELAETAFAIVMKERWGGRWRARRTGGRSRRRAARLLLDTISRYEVLLTPGDHFPVPLGDITAAAVTFMTALRHGILRCGPRGNGHLRRCRNDRQARHRLRAPAFCAAHDVHRPLATGLVSHQAITLRQGHPIHVGDALPRRPRNG
ncbi:MAG TPA: hypothetical protein VMB51_10080 [Solirubrobacteraceae bacterium]|nr:hypothetical protein [Solirubrobacteraceae bacterium]